MGSGAFWRLFLRRQNGLVLYQRTPSSDANGTEGQGCPSGEEKKRKGFVTPTETNVHGDALCFMAETWAGHRTTESVFNNGWRLVAVGGWWRLAVGGGWRLVVPGACP